MSISKKVRSFVKHLMRHPHCQGYSQYSLEQTDLFLCCYVYVMLSSEKSSTDVLMFKNHVSIILNYIYPIFWNEYVVNSTSSSDITKTKHISKLQSYLTSLFCRVELSLFVRPIKPCYSRCPIPH